MHNSEVSDRGLNAVCDVEPVKELAGIADIVDGAARSICHCLSCQDQVDRGLSCFHSTAVPTSKIGDTAINIHIEQAVSTICILFAALRRHFLG